jgi:hypothetical protein
MKKWKNKNKTKGKTVRSKGDIATEPVQKQCIAKIKETTQRQLGTHRSNAQNRTITTVKYIKREETMVKER